MTSIKEIIKTCDSSPQQYEILLENGHRLYFRYRWGTLTITISPFPTEKIEDAVSGEEIYCIEPVNIGEYLTDEEVFFHILQAIKYVN